MDKIKSFLSPGSKAEDETMHGSGDNAGKVAGEGSHFGSTRHPAGASENVALGGGSSDAASITAVKDGVTGPFSETTTSTGVHTDAIRAAQVATNTPIHAEMTANKPTSPSHGSPYSSHGVDPRVDGSAARTTRDTTTGSGLAAAAADAAYTADKSNRGPEHTNVATVPSSTNASNLPSTATTQPTAVHPSAQPPSNIGTAVTTGSAPFESSTSSHKAPINTTPDLSSTYGSTATSQPDFSSSNTSTAQHSALPIHSGRSANEPEHHVGRDTALGAGVGAAGVGAYEASRSHAPADSTTTTSGTDGKPLGSLRDLIDAKTGAGSSPSTGSALGHSSGTTGPSATGATSGLTSGSNTSGLTSNNGTSTGNTAAGLPLGTIRPLIDEKTGSHAADQTAGSREVGSSSRVGASGDIPPSLPLGTLRPLIDEKTGSHAADQTTGSREVGSSSRAGTSSDIPSSLPLGTLRPLIDEKTGSHAADQNAGSREVDSSSRAGTLGDIPSSLPLGTIRPLIDEKTGSHAADQSAGSREVNPSSTSTGFGSSSTSAALAPSTTGAHPTTATGSSIAPTSTSHSGASSGPTSGGIGSLRALIDEKTGSHSATDSAGSHQVPGGATSGLTGSSSTTAPGTTSTSDHHHGRDAALGAGAGGAALGAYEAGKHHDSTSGAQPSSNFQSSAPIQPVTNETNRSIDPTSSSGSHPTTSTGSSIPGASNSGLSSSTTGAQPTSEHHLGRDAAIGAGVGAGAGATATGLHGSYDHLGGIRSNAGTTDQPPTLVGASSKVATSDLPPSSISGPPHTGLGSSSAASQTGATAGLTSGATTSTSAQPQAENKDHHYGRDAAIGAGVVGAGAEAHHARGTEHEEAEPHKQGAASKIKSLFSRNKGDKEHHEDKQHNEKHHDETHHDDKHHHGKEASTGAGVVGAGAVGAHEYEKHHAGSSAIDPARSDPATDFPQAASEQKVYRDSLGHLQTDPTTRSAVAPTGSDGAGVVRDNLGHYSTTGEPTTSTTDSHHRGLEAAGAGAGLAGAGALGAHEHNKHHDTTGNTTSGPAATQHGLHSGSERHADPADRHSYAYHPHHAHQNTAATTTAATTNDPTGTHHGSHHKEEAALAGAGGVGASALAKEHHDQHSTGAVGTAGTAGGLGGLGTSQGYVNEGYVHQKTEADIAAERRNSIPVVGLLHREGRFHGKEGGAPGAVGVPPEERDQAYIESQRHQPILHGSHAEGKEKKGGILGIFSSSHKNDTATAGHHEHDTTSVGHDQAGTTTTGQHEHERSRLHKDPPANHPAAQAAAALEGHHAGSSTGTGGLLHGHHADTLPNNPDVNVEHGKHDPANMGYTGQTYESGL